MHRAAKDTEFDSTSRKMSRDRKPIGTRPDDRYVNNFSHDVPDRKDGRTFKRFTKDHYTINREDDDITEPLPERPGILLYPGCVI